MYLYVFLVLGFGLQSEVNEKFETPATNYTGFGLAGAMRRSIQIDVTGAKGV